MPMLSVYASGARRQGSSKARILLEEAIRAQGECVVFGDLNTKAGKSLTDLEAVMLRKFGKRDQRSGNDQQPKRVVRYRNDLPLAAYRISQGK